MMLAANDFDRIARADRAGNPALLKLDLYCRGLRLDDSCLVEEDGGRRVLRTRAGLGSGLELILPGGLWTNVPVAEPFAQQSPYLLRRRGGSYLLERDGRPVAPVRLSPRPAWYDATTSTGKPMTRIGTLQGTYLGIYQAKVCEYWTAKPKINCKFCSVGLNLGVDEAGEKSIDEVLEVVRAARDESGITYVDFNTGHYEGDTYLDLLEPYILRIKRELGLLVGVQTPPHHDLSRYDGLREMGVNRVSFCFEVFDRRIFHELCPGKDAAYGLDRYLEAIRYCAALAGKGPRREPWVTNGENHRRPRAARVVDRGHRLDRLGRGHSDGVRVPPADRHRPRGPGAAAHRGAGAGLPAPLRSVDGARAADRLCAQRPRLAGPAARGVRAAVGPPFPLAAGAAHGAAPGLRLRLQAAAGAARCAATSGGGGRTGRTDRDVGADRQDRCLTAAADRETMPARKIAVLTSGGDAPGMNAAVRAVVRSGIDRGWEVAGVRNGYAGLIAGDLIPVDARAVGGIIQLGGTVLGSARCPEFREAEARQAALGHLAAQGVSALVVIGGDGSQRGAHALSAMGFPVAGVASTIDNDLDGSEITIGVDTALNVALEAIDRLKITASAQRRAFLVEVMGRHCGYLALMAGIAGGAEAVLIPELETGPEELAELIRAAYGRGKRHALVVVPRPAR